MKSICEEFRSGKMLRDSLENLIASIEEIYTPETLDVRYEYCNAAQHVVFLCQCVLSDLIEGGNVDLNGTVALRLAISLADYRLTQKLISDEVNEIRREQPEYEYEFLLGIKKMIDDRQFGVEWGNLVKNLEVR